MMITISSQNGVEILTMKNGTNDILFSPFTIGSLAMRNRLVRSATAERLADPITGAPNERMQAMYLALALGGVGTIITGHAYVHLNGKCHPEMSSISEDSLIRSWREVILPAQQAGARVIMQINHGGASCDPAITPFTLSPSGVRTNPDAPSRELAESEIMPIITAFGQAACRAREAGLDGVQIHGAHGYLVSQFLTPRTNRRSDAWGGDCRRRLAFLQAIVAEIRHQVGTDYPVWIKLGVAGAPPDELTLAEGALAAQACVQAGIECIELSHALGTPPLKKEEPTFLPWAQAVRKVVGPNVTLALVNGFRHADVMESVLASGLVQLVSLCRPLIADPNFPLKLQQHLEDKAVCNRCDKCWPQTQGEGVACHNKHVQEKRDDQAAPQPIAR
jgi:2,4-dienoyl-CoA reductase-like NADH-dependent reductase (Old Yellow Enzyme family)